MKNNVRQVIRDKLAWHSPPLSEEERAKGFPGWHSRGYLPHFDAPGLIQFITFRLDDALPVERRSEWEALLAIEDERKRRTQLEEYIDRGYGLCWLSDARVAELVQEALLFFDDERYRLLAWVVMPNHVHVLIELREIPMSKILSSWKGFTAKEANRILERAGRFWQVEYFDRYIRDEEHFRKAVHDIEWNPVKAHLVQRPEEWKWSSATSRNEENSADSSSSHSQKAGPGVEIVQARNKEELADVDVCAPIRIGIFAKTFVRPTLEEVLDAVVEPGIRCVQFNFTCAGLPSMPDQIDQALLDEIRRAMEVRTITMSAISGTFNMIHPKPQKRIDGLQRLAVMARACRSLGTSIITLCTGTRDPEDMWRRHPENNAPEAWKDLITSMHTALQIAEGNHVTLGVEPEPGNVIDSAKKARRLLDELRSAHLKIVMDGANLFHGSNVVRMREILDEAFDLLGRDIVIAHAKDLNQNGEAGTVPAGKGVLDYDHYIRLLRKTDFHGPLILHSLTEAQVSESVAFLEAKLRDTEKVKLE
jgi:sugar phosphate isomerase/epimerase/REP element-mobilizing transposase RayT